MNAYASLVPSLRIPPVSWHQIWGDWQSLPDPDERERKVAKCDAKFMGERMQAYQRAGLDYPFELTAMPVGFQVAVGSLTQRAQEVAAYLEMTEEYPPDFNIPQFADVNMSLGYVIGSAEALALSTNRIPTLVCTSIIFMRVRVDDNLTRWKLVQGEHLLAVVGFPLSISTAPKELCSRLAGNAFSGFPCGAVVLAALSSYGLDV